jgi:hypothetical protein
MLGAKGAPGALSENDERPKNILATVDLTAGDATFSNGRMRLRWLGMGIGVASALRASYPDAARRTQYSPGTAQSRAVNCALRYSGQTPTVPAGSVCDPACRMRRLSPACCNVTFAQK